MTIYRFFEQGASKISSIGSIDLVNGNAINVVQSKHTLTNKAHTDKTSNRYMNIQRAHGNLLNHRIPNIVFGLVTGVDTQGRPVVQYMRSHMKLRVDRRQDQFEIGHFTFDFISSPARIKVFNTLSRKNNNVTTSVWLAGSQIPRGETSGHVIYMIPGHVLGVKSQNKNTVSVSDMGRQVLTRLPLLKNPSASLYKKTIKRGASGEKFLPLPRPVVSNLLGYDNIRKNTSSYKGNKNFMATIHHIYTSLSSTDTKRKAPKTTANTAKKARIDVDPHGPVIKLYDMMIPVPPNSNKYPRIFTSALLVPRGTHIIEYDHLAKSVPDMPASGSRSAGKIDHRPQYTVHQGTSRTTYIPYTMSADQHRQNIGGVPVRLYEQSKAIDDRSSNNRMNTPVSSSTSSGTSKRRNSTASVSSFNLQKSY